MIWIKGSPSKIFSNIRRKPRDRQRLGRLCDNKVNNNIKMGTIEKR